MINRTLDLIDFLKNRNAKTDNDILDAIATWLASNAGKLDINGSYNDVYDAVDCLNTASGNSDDD
jgi:hypothetical protein